MLAELFITILEWSARLFRRPRFHFRYFDGVRYRLADPFEVTRSLFAASSIGFDWDETPKMLQTGVIVEQLQAMETIGLAVRQSFKLPAVEHGGLSEMECFQLLADLNEFLGGVKKNGSLLPISLFTSELQPSVDGDRSATKPGSVSGSTANGPSVVQPGLPAEQIHDESAPMSSPA